VTTPVAPGGPAPAVDPQNPSSLPFPENVVAELQMTFIEQNLFPFDTVLARPLRPTDPAVSLGMFAVDWVPDDRSHEVGRTHGPTLSTYVFAVQGLIRHGDEQSGLRLHSILAKNIRSMLDRNQGLHVRLAGLSEASLGVAERAQRWGVRGQRFANNEVGGSFIYLSTTEFWLETEST
jgi:hypothetical protein